MQYGVPSIADMEGGYDGLWPHTDLLARASFVAQIFYDSFKDDNSYHTNTWRYTKAMLFCGSRRLTVSEWQLFEEWIMTRTG